VKPIRRTIRPSRAADLDALIDIGRRSWLSAFAQTAPFDLIVWWVREDRTNVFYRECWPAMMVLEEDGALIGLVQPKDDEINGLWVHPAHQGTGAGKILLRAGEDIIRSAGHQAVWLTCSGFNEKALHFYRGRGYVETRHERGRHVCGVEVVDIRLERRLAERRMDGG